MTGVISTVVFGRRQCRPSMLAPESPA